MKWAGILIACWQIWTGSIQHAAAESIGSTWIPVHVMIDVGHGGVDGGAFYQDILEKEINLQIARLLYKKLEELGYFPVLNRLGDYALSEENKWFGSSSRHLRDLAQRKQLAKELPAEIVVSVHANWSNNPAERGPLVLYQRSNQSYPLAELIQTRLNHLLLSKEKPLAVGRYYLLRQSFCPTVIVEVGYMSNFTDRQRMTHPQGQEKIATAIATAIQEYLLLFGGLRAE